MVNFREKMLSFRHLCYKNGYLFAAFLIPVILMGIAYISFGYISVWRKVGAVARP